MDIVALRSLLDTLAAIMISFISEMEFSYSTSDHIRESLTRIDYLRAKIYLASLTIKEELRLRWEAGILRTFFTFSLADQPFSKNKLSKF